MTSYDKFIKGFLILWIRQQTKLYWAAQNSLPVGRNGMSYEVSSYKILFYLFFQYSSVSLSVFIGSFNLKQVSLKLGFFHLDPWKLEKA